MVIHVAQVHKESVSRVPNALPGRDNVGLEIFGIQGVPLEDLVRHYEEVGANVSKTLKTIHNVNSNYAVGPGMMTRAPLMSALTGSSSSVRSASSSDTSGSSIVPAASRIEAANATPFSEGAASDHASVVGSEKSTSVKTGADDSQAARFLPAVVSDGLASVVKITSFGCPKNTSKNSVLVYSDRTSIEERRIAHLVAKSQSGRTAECK